MLQLRGETADIRPIYLMEGRPRRRFRTSDVSHGDMNGELIEWNGQPIALLVHSEDGDPYLVPPVVFDTDGVIVMGEPVLKAIVQSGEGVELPVIENCTPALLAELDEQLARISEQLGAPIRLGW